MSTHQPIVTWPLTPEQMALIRRKAALERAEVVAQFGHGIARAVKRLFRHRPTNAPIGQIVRQGG
jgi:acyl CoA:acetate/3-ketoacid CoA transferase